MGILFGNKFLSKGKKSKTTENKVVNKYILDKDYKSLIDKELEIIKKEISKYVKDNNIGYFTYINIEDNNYEYSTIVEFEILNMDVYDYANKNKLNTRQDIEEIQDKFFKIIKEITKVLKDNKNIKHFSKLDLQANDCDDHIFTVVFK